MTGKLVLDEGKLQLRMKGLSDKARMAMQSEIVRDCDSYVPLRTGFLKNSASASIAQKNDQIVYKAPYAKFQYYGKGMVGIRSGKAWANEGETKVLNGKDLHYGRSSATPRWFEKAKASNLKKWLQIAKKEFK